LQGRRHLANGRSAPFTHRIGNKSTGAALSEHSHKSRVLAVAAATQTELQKTLVCFAKAQQKRFSSIN